MRSLLFTFFLLMQISIYAQDYIPLLNNTNEWQLINCYEDECLTDAYHTDGDTIAFGNQYKILDGYHYISRKFLIRENVQEKKIYLNAALNGQSNEYLLYDFGLEEGDEFRMQNPISPFPEDLGYFKVDSIRMKPINETQQSRFFYFSPIDSNEEGFGFLPVWVEGVGSLSLINAPGGNPDYYGVGQVSCFWKNSDVFYHDATMETDCQSMMNTKDFYQTKVKFVVTRQKIGLFSNTQNVSKLKIFDSSGKLYKHLNHSKSSIIEIDLSDLPKGIYFISLLDNGHPVKIPFMIK